MKHLIPNLFTAAGITCVILMASCSGSNQNDAATDSVIDFSRFTATDMSNSGRIVVNNPDILGIVYSIEAINDSIVAICQSNRLNHVALYNLNSGASQTAMTRGEGPDEMFRVSTISSDSEGNLWLVGLMDQKVMKATWNNDGEKALVEPAFKLPNDFFHGVTNYKGGIIGLPLNYQESRLLEVGPAGEAIDSVGSFPKAVLPEDVRPSNFLFQSDMAYSPEAQKVAIACKSWNYIDIVNTDTKATISLELPIDEPIALEEVTMGQATRYNPRPFYLIASGVDATPNSFLVGYIGVKVESPEDMAKNVNSILEFDWNGKPLRKFNFSNEVTAFSVSPDGEKLYTVENAPDPILYEYSLK